MVMFYYLSNGCIYPVMKIFPVMATINEKVRTIILIQAVNSTTGSIYLWNKIKAKEAVKPRNGQTLKP